MIKRETTSNSYIPFENYPDLMTVDDIQAALGVGRNTAYQLIHNGDLQCLKIGRSIRIPKRYLMDFVYGSCYNTYVASGLAHTKEAQA
ncbi:MAG: helix-turn-helix domain-containing protein [Clostridiales bacterium]|nr:helix-turn-helix domain-containing protein [Clostridiales bacterium]